MVRTAYIDKMCRGSCQIHAREWEIEYASTTFYFLMSICRRKVKALPFFLSDDSVAALIDIEKDLYLHLAFPVSAVPDEVDFQTFAEPARRPLKCLIHVGN